MNRFLKPALAGSLLGMALLGFLAGCMKRPSTLSPLPGGSQGRGALPGMDGVDEVWIVARGDQHLATADDMPGSGALLAQVEERQVEMPLKHTAVRASVCGYLGTVEVTQQFQNPYSGKIEAVYVFPLPPNAAVNEFVMTIGERRIRGIIRERAEAERLYQDAKRQGYVASLLTQERPNVFTQSVANIEPGRQIDVHIRYFHTLDYVDGWYEFVFPMVVGPRFNPPGSTQGVGAVARGQTRASGQATEVHYLRPEERTRHDISLSLDIDAGVAIEQFTCATHRVQTENVSPQRLTARLDTSDALPNKDFVFRYRVAGDRIKSGLVVHRDERGGYFSLMLFPPEQIRALKRQPLELVFVIDCSGSMNGRPIDQAKAAVDRGLELLEPGDSFQIISFSMQASQLGNTPLPATDRNVARGRHFLQSLRGEGGTMMIEGIKAALEFPHDPARLRFVCFLTDGFIGNETEILGAIEEKLGPARIFSFGIGSSVNRYLIDHMARSGRGAVAYLGLRDSGAAIMEDFFLRISHPAMTSPRIDWGGMQVSEVFPRVVPDLFVGRPVILTGRFAGEPGGNLRVLGHAAGETVEVEIPITPGTATPNPALPSVWARMKIADLSAQSLQRSNPDLPEAIRQVALDYSLLSPFTAFVAVDSTRRTEGSEGTTVPVAVPVPEGVKYDTTVQEKEK